MQIGDCVSVSVNDWILNKGEKVRTPSILLIFIPISDVAIQELPLDRYKDKQAISC